MRDIHLPGRSPVMATGAMAATSHPLATWTALETLREGGNAIDAAIAAAAVLGVVEPQSTSIGGDCFCLYMPGGNGKVIALNGSGRAPAAATVEWFAERGLTEIGAQSPHSVTVPGSIAAWARLSEDHGRKGLDSLLQPAIRFAEEGYPVHPVVARTWQSLTDKLANDENCRRVFLPEGRAPRAGEIHRQPALARTMRRIAAEGRDGFYTGEVAEDIVSYLRGLGGLHSLDDFAECEADYVEPISTAYRGYDIYECPPNGQGIVALMMLNLLEGFDLAALDPLGVERLHLEAEVTRLTYRDRNVFVADPTQANVPIGHLLSKAYADQLRPHLRPDRVMTEMPLPGMPDHQDTVYLCVVDEDRNVASFINSIFHSWGSGRMSAKTGVTLSNRGTGFRLDPDHLNCIAPRKRPMHTIIPGMMVRDGRAVMPFGVMGGHFQPVGHVHFVTNLLDFAMDPQEALDAPRAFAFDGELRLERGIRPEVARGLAALGHKPVETAFPLGGGQAIRIDWQTGVLTGGSDPRKDGCALGF